MRPNRPARLVGITIVLATVAGCSPPDAPGVSDSAAPIAAPGRTVTDSALPRDEEMRRFTAGMSAAPTTLQDGAPSADSLVGRYARALQARDTATLRRLRIDRGEFAFLYYPTAKLSKPPYDLSPALMWFQLEGNSGRGLYHALEERAGRPLAIVGHRCRQVELEGANRIHSGCTVRRVQVPSDTVEEQLFGAMIERGGVHKFVSYSNKL